MTAAAMTAAELAALHAACFTLPPPWSAQTFAALQADPAVICLTEQQAMILARVVAGEAEILTLAVHPGCRRQGLARRLVQSLHHRLAATATVVFLEVAADNPAARALYQAMGYRQVGLRRGYYRSAAAEPIDALVLRCAIPAAATPII